MTEIKSVKATGEWVICEAREVGKPEEKKTKSGIVMPGKQGGQSVNTNAGKKSCDLFVLDIGPQVPKEKINYKVGDDVIVDNYDMQQFGDDDKDFIICHYTKIKAVITTA